MTAQFLGNIILKGKLETLTGLHIGGSKEKMEIGGVDSPVIRDPATKLPYIPGSSLKGKMRALLEFALGKITNDKGSSPGCRCNEPDCPVCRVFGMMAEESTVGPTRLLVRDAHPDQETITMWRSMDSELVYTEYKPENSVDRLTSAANPRFLERVVKGSFFDVEFVFGVYRVDGDAVKDETYFKYVIEALKLLEHSALGKSGSRGYGQVSFKFTEPFVVTREDYQRGTQIFKDASKPHSDPFFNRKFTRRLSEFDDSYINTTIVGKFSDTTPKE